MGMLLCWGLWNQNLGQGYGAVDAQRPFSLHSFICVFIFHWKQSIDQLSPLDAISKGSLSTLPSFIDIPPLLLSSQFQRALVLPLLVSLQLTTDYFLPLLRWNHFGMDHHLPFPEGGEPTFCSTATPYEDLEKERKKDRQTDRHEERKKVIKWRNREMGDYASLLAPAFPTWKSFACVS